MLVEVVVIGPVVNVFGSSMVPGWYPIAPRTSAAIVTVVLKAIQFVPSNFSFSGNICGPLVMPDMMS